MDFTRALDATLGAFASEAGFDGLREPGPVMAWRELALQAGPTKPSGPATHDLLAPAGETCAFGINVFSHGGRDLVAAAADWAAAYVGEAAAGHLREFVATLPPRVAVHAGCATDGETWRLKLWFGGPDTARVASALALPAPASWSHIGVDLWPDGLRRARGYRPARDAPSDWEGAAAWADTADDAPRTSHRLFASLGRSRAANAKRSFDLIFRPDATLDDLWHEARRCAALGAACRLDRDLLVRVAEAVAAAGCVLRPAAYEVDVYAEGRVETDALLSIGVPRAPEAQSHVDA